LILRGDGFVASDYQRQSALAHLHLHARVSKTPADADFTLCERPYRGQLLLRGEATDMGFAAAVTQVLGVGLPAEPNTSARAGQCAALWLGPDEWLIVLPDGSETETLSALTEALHGRHHAVTDVSDGRAVIGLAGPRARDVLMKGCSLDLHPRIFAADQCAQTRLARCQVLLHQVEATPAYDVYAQRSFADYVWRWLEDAASEYDVVIVNPSE
jgi:sarcosine oxidase subunit gamma